MFKYLVLRRRPSSWTRGTSIFEGCRLAPLGRQPGSRGRGRQLPFAAATARGGTAHRIEFQRLGGLELLRLFEFLGCHVNSPSLGYWRPAPGPLLVDAERPGKLAQFFAWQLGFASEVLLHISGNATNRGLTRGVRHGNAIRTGIERNSNGLKLRFHYSSVALHSRC